MVLDSSSTATVCAGWLWEMRSAIVARVRNRNPMEGANDLVRARFLAITSGLPTNRD
jgi:hypothetical protein